jgi:hypothetical protein
VGDIAVGKYKGIPFKAGQRWRYVQSGKIYVIRSLIYKSCELAMSTTGVPFEVEEIQNGSLRLLLDKGVCNENT